MPFHIGNQVIPIGLKPELIPVFFVALGVAIDKGWTVWWSSSYDRKHSGKSKHYGGMAGDWQFFDAAGNDVSHEGGQLMAQRIKCVDYDILPEPDHAHGEYDPRRPGQEARRYPKYTEPVNV